MTTGYCTKCRCLQPAQVDDTLFPVYRCASCGGLLMSPAPDEPTEIEVEEWNGESC